MKNIYRNALGFTICMLILFVTSASAELIIDKNYHLMSSARAGRTAYDYTYQVSITNNGVDVINVAASVTSASPNTTVIDGNVNFGEVHSGNTVQGTDTFTIRQDRRYAFDPNSLTWNIQYDIAPQIILSEGGVIQGEGGVSLIVPAGATPDPIPVTITLLQQNDLGTPPPPNTTFLGGVNIDMGQNELSDNADISMPTPEGVPDGSEVYLAKLVQYAGKTMYQMVDTAIVQNGVIQSQDPAFPGVIGSGNYCFLWAQVVGWVQGKVTKINSGAAVPGAVVTLSDGYWLDIADYNGNYSLPVWFGSFVVTAFDEKTGDHGEKQGFMPSNDLCFMPSNDLCAYINIEIGESVGPIQGHLVNGNFETGNFTGWELSGAGDVVDSFGPITPYEGNHMAMISSGDGAVGEASSALEQSFVVPEGESNLIIHYNFVSEEYPEFVGSQFNDVMLATLHTPDGSREIAFEEVNSANFEPVSGIPCGSGDCTWGQTGWLEVSIDVSQWAGTGDTLTLTVHDVGDTIYDTVVLVDDITIGYIVAQALENARNNIGRTTGDCIWHGVTNSGVWADPNMTYCARFVAFCFGQESNGNAINVYNHYNNLGLIKTGINPPSGAVVFYAAHSENGNFGHVGIVSNRKLISVTSKATGVKETSIFGYFNAPYLGYVTATEFVDNY